MSWNENVCGYMEEAEVILILKSEKDPKRRESYRPVSLMSVCVKVLERMAVNRLSFWIEREGVLNKLQAGFQRGRITEEQVVRVVQEIQDGWEKKKSDRTIVVTLDRTKAYDREWKVRMMDEGVREDC